MTKVITAVLLFSLMVLPAGCLHKAITVSPVEDPIWLEEGESAPFPCWAVTQGWMAERIEETE